MTDEQVWLDRAVDLATANVGSGGGPFGAVVVRGDVMIGEGANRVTAERDPTAHAEVVAIRAACRTIEDFSLTGATLYASCEPCPLCLSASLWARVDAVVYSADSSAAARAGFDDDDFRRLFHPEADAERWPLGLRHHPTARSEEPFDAWRTKADRIAY
ncbi:MAG TPA: nucleoside deaminase [Ornithinibacter sp.]|nr:nucleoside deaminase [Ornithinibacter sp.]